MTVIINWIYERWHVTTTFRGKTASVTLAAFRAANQMVRLTSTRHCHGNQRAGLRCSPPRLAADAWRYVRDAKYTVFLIFRTNMGSLTYNVGMKSI